MNITSTLKQKRRGTKILSLLTLLLSLATLQSAGQQEIVFSEFFPTGSNVTGVQCQAWMDFADQLTDDKTYTAVLIKGSRDEDGLLLEDPLSAAQLASAIHNSEQVDISVDGQFWTTYIFQDSPVWISASSAGTEHSAGSCVTGTEYYCIRACLENPNWGGINGPICGAEGQRLDLIFYHGGITLLENNSATCHEASDGSLLVEVNDDETPYTFAWSNGVSTSGSSTTSQIDNLSPGEYTLTCTNAVGTEYTESFIVGPDPIEVSFDMTQTTTCDGAGDGAATANVTGGTAPYTYSWDSGENTQSISNKGFGSYAVTVTDANNCNPVTESVEITADDNTLPTAQAQDIEVYLDADGIASIVADDLDNGSSDDCAIATKTIDVSNFSCQDIGADPSFDGVTAMTFDGTDDRIDMPGTIMPLPNQTVAFWMKAAPGTSGNIFGWGGAGTNNYSMISVWSGRLRPFSGNGTPPVESVLGTATVVDGSWHHVAMSTNIDGDVTLWVDGLLDVTGAFTKMVNSPNAPSIGAAFANGTHQGYFAGEIDDFVFASSVLTEEEINELICSGPQGIASLEAYYDFSDGTGSSSVTDLAGSHGSATLNEDMDANTAWTPFGDSVPTSCPPGVKVTLTVSDAGGNEVSANAYVTVNDTVSPVAIAQAHSLELDANGMVTATASDFDDNSTDNCGIDGFSLSKTHFDCDDVGVNTIVLQVTDIHGNSKSVSTQVTIEDNLSPLALAQNITVELDQNGFASITGMDADDGSEDNCLIASRSLSISEFSCEDIGTHDVTLTVTDAAGNQDATTFTVTVEDNIGPSIPDGVGMTLYVDENGEGIVDTAPMLDEMSDACGLGAVFLDGLGDTEDMALNGLTFDCEAVGEGGGSPAYITDVNGNSTPFLLNLSILDTIKPTFSLTELELTLDASGNTEFSAEMLMDYAADNCGVNEIILDDGSSLGCADLGTASREVTIVDFSGNSITRTITVTTVDNITPFANADDLVLELDENGSASLTALEADDGSEDNCLITSREISLSEFSCEDIGTHEVTLTVTDAAGNEDETTFTVTVEDNVGPTVPEELPLTLYLDENGEGIADTSPLLTEASDACGLGSVFIQGQGGFEDFEIDGAFFDCEAVGEGGGSPAYITDANGNSTPFLLNISILDTIKPTFSLTELELTLDASGNSGFSEEMLMDYAADNCGIDEIILDDESAPNCTDLGTTSREVTIVDFSGNSITRTIEITTVDNIPPFANADDLVLELDEDGFASLTALDADDGSEDNCLITSREISLSDFSCEDVGTHEVTLTVTDAAGNEDATTFTVTVEDNVGPSVPEELPLTLYLDENGEGIADTSPLLAEASDACGLGAVFIEGQGGFDDFAIDGLPIDCELVEEGESSPAYITDVNGNQTGFLLSMNVLDTIKPSFSLTELELSLDAAGSTNFSAAMLMDYAADNCGIDEIILSDDSSPGCADVGTTSREVTIVDFSGNSITRTIEITTVDNIPPFANADDLVLELDEDGFASLTALDADDGSEDNCLIASRSLSISEFSCEDIGTHDVTLTVTDAAGNEDATTFTVTVEDNVGPSIPEELDFTLYLDENGEVIVNTTPLLAQASDGCGVAAIGIDKIEDINGFPLGCNDAFPEGTTASVYDINGNETNFILNMYILDTISPVFSLEEIELTIDGGGNASLTEEMLMAYASDNCGIAEIAIQNEFFDCSQLGEFATEVVVFDLNGNVTQRTLLVTLLDDVSPTVQVEPVSMSLDEEGIAVLDPEQLDMLTTENCGIVSYTFSQPQFDCDNLGVHTVSLTVADAAGNTATTEFEVTIADTEDPTISGPENVEICEGENFSLKLEVGDNCSYELEQVQGPDSSTPEIGEYVIETTATDPSGNSASHFANLTVHPSPSVDLGDDQEVLLGDLVTLVAGTDPDLEYTWSDGSTGPTLEFTAEETITVSVLVSNDLGCEDEDFITITVVDPLGVEDENGNSVSIFPNPTAGELNLTLGLVKNTNKLQLSIMDLSGKVVLQQQITVVENGQVVTINMAHLADGIYLVNLKDEEVNLTQRVVKH